MLEIWCPFLLKCEASNELFNSSAMGCFPMIISIADCVPISLGSVVASGPALAPVFLPVTLVEQRCDTISSRVYPSVQPSARRGLQQTAHLQHPAHAAPSPSTLFSATKNSFHLKYIANSGYHKIERI